MSFKVKLNTHIVMGVMISPRPANVLEVKYSGIADPGIANRYACKKWLATQGCVDHLYLRQIVRFATI